MDARLYVYTLAHVYNICILSRNENGYSNCLNYFWTLNDAVNVTDNGVSRWNATAKNALFFTMYFQIKEENTEIHVGAALRDMKLQKAHLRVTPLTAIFLSKKKDRTIHVRTGTSAIACNNGWEKCSTFGNINNICTVVVEEMLRQFSVSVNSSLSVLVQTSSYCTLPRIASVTDFAERHFFLNFEKDNMLTQYLTTG